MPLAQPQRYLRFNQPATFTIVPPIQNQWYTAIDEYGFGVLYSIVVSQTNNAGAIKGMNVRVSWDGWGTTLGWAPASGVNNWMHNDGTIGLVASAGVRLAFGIGYTPIFFKQCRVEFQLVGVPDVIYQDIYCRVTFGKYVLS